MTNKSKKRNRSLTQSGAKTAGQRLAQVRKERGYTQSGLSRVMGIPQNVISEYESGHRRINAEVLTRFAVTLSISADELLGLKKRMGRRPEPPGMKILRRMEKLQKLSEPMQSHILKTLDMIIEGARKR